MLGLIKRFRDWRLRKQYIKKTAQLEIAENSLKEFVEYIIKKEQPMINTLEGQQKLVEEEKLKQKILAVTKKDREKINTLREELNKMADKSTLKIVDGKLVRSTPEPQPQQGVDQQPDLSISPPPQPTPEAPMQPQELPPIPQEVPQAPLPQMPPQPQMPPYPQIPNPMEQAMPEMVDQYAQEQQQIPPQQFTQPPQVPPQQQLPEVVTVTLLMTEGRQLSVTVPSVALQQFFTELNEAIESQGVFQLTEKQSVSGRHIVGYEY